MENKVDISVILPIASSFGKDFHELFEKAIDSIKKQQPLKTIDLNLGKVFYPFTAYGEPLNIINGTFKDDWNKFKNNVECVANHNLKTSIQ